MDPFKNNLQGAQAGGMTGAFTSNQQGRGQMARYSGPDARAAGGRRDNMGGGRGALGRILGQGRGRGNFGQPSNTGSNMPGSQGAIDQSNMVNTAMNDWQANNPKGSGSPPPDQWDRPVDNQAMFRPGGQYYDQYANRGGQQIGQAPTPGMSNGSGAFGGLAGGSGGGQQWLRDAQNSYNQGTSQGRDMSWMRQPGALSGPGGSGGQEFSDTSTTQPMLASDAAKYNQQDWIGVDPRESDGSLGSGWGGGQQYGTIPNNAMPYDPNQPGRQYLGPRQLGNQLLDSNGQPGVRPGMGGLQGDVPNPGQQFLSGQIGKQIGTGPYNGKRLPIRQQPQQPPRGGWPTLDPNQPTYGQPQEWGGLKGGDQSIGLPNPGGDGGGRRPVPNVQLQPQPFYGGGNWGGGQGGGPGNAPPPGMALPPVGGSPYGNMIMNPTIRNNGR